MRGRQRLPGPIPEYYGAFTAPPPGIGKPQVTDRLLKAVTGHCGQFGLTGNDVLCRTGRGTLLRRDSFNREIWKPAITAAQLPEDTTFHDLRRTFASTALAEGVPISEVSRWLGHKSLTTTVDL
jgi:integrase